MKRFAYTAAAIALAGTSVSLLQRDTPAQAQVPGLPTARVAQSDMAVDADQCVVKLRTQDQAELASERPGIIEFVEFKQGDTVKKGDVIARLKDAVARATYEKNKLQATNDVHIRYAEAAFKVAQQELQIALDANARVPGAVPKVEVEKLRLSADKAALQREQAIHEQDVARATVHEAEETLKTHEITAPFSGVVSAVYRTEGEAVRQGDPIVEIISTETISIEGLVTIRESYAVKKGDRVVVELDAEYYRLPQGFEDHKLPGKITFVDPKAISILGKAKVYAEVDNSLGLLRPELRAKMKIVPAGAPQTAATRR